VKAKGKGLTNEEEKKTEKGREMVAKTKNFEQ